MNDKRKVSRAIVLGLVAAMATSELLAGDAAAHGGSTTATGPTLAGRWAGPERPLLVARRRRRRGRRPPPRRVRRPPKMQPSTPPPAAKAEPAAPAAAAPPSGALRRGARVEFDGRLVQGQTAKSGAIYLFARKRAELRSMVKERKAYRKEILRTVYPEF